VSTSSSTDWLLPGSTSDNIPSLDHANAKVARPAISVRMRNGDLMINRLSVSRCLPLLCCCEKEGKGSKKEKGAKVVVFYVSEDKVGHKYRHHFVLALSLVPDWSSGAKTPINWAFIPGIWVGHSFVQLRRKWEYRSVRCSSKVLVLLLG